MADQSSNEPPIGSGDELSPGLDDATDDDVQPADSSGEAGGADATVSTADVSGEPTTDPASVSHETPAPAGWFQDPNVPNQQRYWDGSDWTDQTKQAEAGINTTKRSADERKALLAQQLQGAAARGLRVESQSEFQAVLVEGQPVNHVLHAIVTIFSCGLWGIVWIILAVTGGEKREMIIVDEFGNVQLQKLGKT